MNVYSGLLSQVSKQHYLITKISCACQLKTYNNFQVKPVILLRNLCSVHLPEHYCI